MKQDARRLLTNKEDWLADITNYAVSVTTGQKLACIHEKHACQRFLNDYQAQHNPDFPYAFNQLKAWKVIAFIEQLPHVKGKWAKATGTERLIKLEPWQKFIIANIFGWVKKHNGFRRYTEAYLRIPRKNGKSCLSAGIALYMLCADGEMGAEVYCGASTEKQANEVFLPAVEIARKTPALKKAFGVTIMARSLKLPNNSKFEPLIGNPGDGGSPHCAVADEYHEHRTSALLDTMQTGMGAREQPLLLIITTSGENIFSPCADKDKDAQLSLTDPDFAPSMFAMLYGIDEDDDWTQPAALIKANPNYGVSVNPEFVLAAQQLAIKKANKQNAFKTKHLNVWCNAKHAFFNLENWNKCADPALKEDDYLTQDCWIGLDFAKKRDLNAKVNVFRKTLGNQVHYYVFTRFYMPEDSITDCENKALKQLLENWALKGYLQTCPGNEMDFNMIRDDVIEDSHKFTVVEVPHDPHGAIQISHDLQDAGLVPVMMTQHGNTYTIPINELEAAIDSGRIHHDGNPVMAWCIANTIVHEYRGGNKMPDKQDADSKIDGTSALLMALARCYLPAPNDSADIIFL